jgi:hypothetical protein
MEENEDDVRKGKTIAERGKEERGGGKRDKKERGRGEGL